jgi:hypothetical protein
MWKENCQSQLLGAMVGLRKHWNEKRNWRNFPKKRSSFIFLIVDYLTAYSMALATGSGSDVLQTLGGNNYKVMSRSGEVKANNIDSSMSLA